MKQIFLALTIAFLLASCTSQQKLAYLNNLPEPSGEERFTMDLPGYKIQPRDILHITAKAMNPESRIEDFLSSSTTGSATMIGGDVGSFLFGYDVNDQGYIRIPVIGTIMVEGLTLDETRLLIQNHVDKVFKNTTVECKLLSFKFTVIGEVRSPGTYINFNNYLTVLEAIGRAGGVGDYGKRDRILVVRSAESGSKTYRLNLHDKSLLTSEAYFLLPNDVVIIEPMPQKIFNMNLPTISFVVTSLSSVLTTTLLLINYLQ